MYKEETKEKVLSRLRLAQKILEDSDILPGIDGYNFKNPEKWWLHPRHEREALVIYLLLTCFDNLGQKDKFLTFENWLKSQKPLHKEEKEIITKSLTEETSDIDKAIKLQEGYHKIYGVKNAFYSGINTINEEEKEKLLKSIHVTYSPKSEDGNKIQRQQSIPIDDKKHEQDLKIKYLYSKRNGFTHSLEQYHNCSNPQASDVSIKNGSSWVILICDKKFMQSGSNTERKNSPNGGSYNYSTFGWPFVLFEVIYSALNIPFCRTSIKLNFRVIHFSDDNKHVTTYDNVEHQNVKNYETFMKIIANK